jgi:hypothetical protein
MKKIKSFESFLKCQIRSCPEKVKNLRKDMVSHFERCHKIMSGIEDLSGQSVRNVFSID